MTAQQLKALLWNDPFFIDLLDDSFANYTPAGLCGAMRVITSQI
jgi:hypothetical protein